MNVDEEENFPFLRWEKRIIRAAIDEAVPVLGICLGAQLIASTLGTAVFHGPVKEIGWSPISITPHGQVDSLLGYLPENATVFQWHSDGFELPAGAIRLASSAALQHPSFSPRQNDLRLAVSSRSDAAHDRALDRRAFERSGARTLRLTRQNSRRYAELRADLEILRGAIFIRVRSAHVAFTQSQSGWRPGD